VVMKASFL